eukprot:TRINITY_DN31396_c0_g1_i1.p1 TRINITY_DN31396_c0_g1~~TRINITY_DN31396_c0_g1_i1.p1  ORF type:complete len:300 (-),score=30.06 TRINITY_DN31396_c0_g1_i1:309-1208(-)
MVRSFTTAVLHGCWRRLGRLPMLAFILLATSAAACEEGHWYDVFSFQKIVPGLCKTPEGELYLTPALDFVRAASHCQADGATLASVRSKEENDRAANVCGRQSCWIGLREETVGSMHNEDWRWIDGSEASYFNWGDGQPDNDEGDEDAVVMCNVEESLLSRVVLRRYFITGVGCPFTVMCCALAVLAYSVRARRGLLEKAEQGERVKPPSHCWRACCPSCAVYYWEGCSPNCAATACIFPCLAACLWAPSPWPLQYGVLVGAPTAVAPEVCYGYGAEFEGARYGDGAEFEGESPAFLPS